MANVTEEEIINKLAEHEKAISGIKESYGYAQNPDNISGKTPCVLHYIPEFNTDLYAHHNVHMNEWQVGSVLFANARESMGGRLGYLENSVIPFMYKWRVKFQTDSVIRDILSLGLTRAYTMRSQYGVGGTLLTHNNIEYIGIIFTFTFTEVN